RILMSRLPLKHDILYLTILIAVNLTVSQDHVRRDLPLHHTGFLGVSAHIIHLVPLLQILSHRLSVEKDDRDVTFPGKIDDLRRISPVYQVHTEDIASRIDQFSHLIILRPLRARRIPDRYD